MTRTTPRRLHDPDAETILQQLSERQFVHPHGPLAEAVARVATWLGIAPSSCDAAIDALKLDRAASIGRLRRTELCQLAHSIRRFARQSASSNCLVENSSIAACSIG